LAGTIILAGFSLMRHVFAYKGLMAQMTSIEPWGIHADCLDGHTVFVGVDAY
jgi:hypothetical protein